MCGEWQLHLIAGNISFFVYGYLESRIVQCLAVASRCSSVKMRCRAIRAGGGAIFREYPEYGGCYRHSISLPETERAFQNTQSDQKHSCGVAQADMSGIDPRCTPDAFHTRIGALNDSNCRRRKIANAMVARKGA
jgi:hypothetical protein